MGAVAPIVGGHDAVSGAWPDAVAVYANGELTCAGVLIAPDVVVTAGHCCGIAGSKLDPPPDHVIIGARQLSAPADGETIDVRTAIPHPSHTTDLDVGLLMLASPSTKPPRALATGWAAAEAHDGATATIAGWGATMSGASTGSDILQEADVPIVEGSCTSVALGCRAVLMPGGELRAGGGGVDTCVGDSGGPLYVHAPYGTFLAATTYAGYVTSGATCGDGGIYERADAFITWAEQASGRTFARAAGPTAAPIEVIVGARGTSAIVVNDPIATAAHTFELATPPAKGAATVDDSGLVTYDARDPGTDTIVVRVHDAATPARAAQVSIDVTVGPGGCCDARGGRGSLLPIAVVALALRRRRR
ncbi:MAG TPA: serine protease [Kofleriaceae bacterium]|nr:serine protease [Kofleriaceae bacterium]